MLNYFLIYPIIWIITLILYMLKLSLFNTELDQVLLMFIVFSSIFSILLGLLFKNKFSFKKNENCDITYKPIVFLCILAIVEFIYMKNIPFISIAATKTYDYDQLSFMPLIHVILSTYALYYSTVCIYTGICSKTNRKKSLISLGIILLIYLLFYARSFMVMVFIIGLNMFVSYLKSEKEIKLHHIFISILLVFVVLYCYGGLGNIRQGYKWNDNRYIEKIGRYTSFPEHIPKQYMWSYSYLTSPLANLNYNITNENSNLKPVSLVSELFPQTITKRFAKIEKSNSCNTIRSYFTVSTSYCRVYVNGSYLGLFTLFGFMILLGIFGIKFSNVKKLYREFYVFCSLLSLVYLFSFFDNMLYYVGTSIPLWISIIVLCLKYRKNKGNQDE